MIRPKRIERETNLGKEEKEPRIDLSSVKMEFCSKQKVKEWHEEKLSELKDKDKWIEENQENFEKKKGQIDKLVRRGELPDARIETLWEVKRKDLEGAREDIDRIKVEIERNKEWFKESVSKQLERYLPAWTPKEIKIVFTINQESDFEFHNNTIIADLYRLSLEKKLEKRVKEGVSHELFHIWMEEENEWSKEERASSKEYFIFKTADEGLAVLVSGQSLEDFHESQGRDYSQYKEESFQKFSSFLEKDDKEEIRKQGKEGLRAMGSFYVVGNEMAKSILKERGMDDFRGVIKKTRQDYRSFYEEYNEICQENEQLPSFNISQ